MQPAREGIYRRCRGLAALLVGLFGAFALASRHDDATTGTAGAAAGAANRSVSRRIDVSGHHVWLVPPEADATEADRNDLNIASSEQGDVIETFDVGADARSFFLPVMIDGQRWWFLVDTGTGQTIVDWAVAIHVGLIDRNRSVLTNGSDRINRFLSAYIGVSRVPVKCEAWCCDLSHLRQSFQFPICGILGMDFLSRYVIGIDWDAGKFSFLRSVPESSGYEFKLSRDRFDRPTVGVDLGGGSVARFLIDTGCVGHAAGAIEKNRFSSMLEQNRMTFVKDGVEHIGFYGSRIHREAKLERLQVGSFEHFDLVFFDYSVNLLGVEYLSRYAVTFDFPNDYLYLKEGKRFAEPTKVDVELDKTRVSEIYRAALERPSLQSGRGPR